jgi:hypothetical protein
MGRFAIEQDTAAGLIRFHLSGFRGYPPTEAGENVFARCLQECCVSVEHAETVLKSFDGTFPTLRDFIEAATNVRSRFELVVSQHAEWEKQYGPAAPFVPDLSGDPLSQHWAKDRQMWARIKQHLKLADFSKVSWAQVYQAKQELGYELTPTEADVLAGMVRRVV